MKLGPQIALPDEFYVRKPFKMATTAGVYACKRGETFRWKDSGIPERRVRQLWDQRWLATDVEMEVDKVRFEAKRAAEQAAIRSAKGVVEEPVEEPKARRQRKTKVVTAEDYDL